MIRGGAARSERIVLMIARSQRRRAPESADAQRRPFPPVLRVLMIPAPAAGIMRPSTQARFSRRIRSVQRTRLCNPHA